MKTYVKFTIIGVIVIVAAWIIFSWIEAEKEIRVLCSVFRTGQDLERVIEILDTGEYLQYQIKANGNEQTLLVESYYNFGCTNCVIKLSENKVISTLYSKK